MEIPQHRFFRVSSSFHNKGWILDPAGSVYGLYADAMANANYIESYVESTKLVLDHEPGFHREKLHGLSQVGGLKGLPYMVLFTAMSYLHAGIDAWEQDSGMALHQLLRLRGSRYARSLMELRSCIHNSMSGMATKPEYLRAVRDALAA